MYDGYIYLQSILLSRPALSVMHFTQGIQAGGDTGLGRLSIANPPRPWFAFTQPLNGMLAMLRNVNETWMPIGQELPRITAGERLYRKARVSLKAPQANSGGM